MGWDEIAEMGGRDGNRLGWWVEDVLFRLIEGMGESLVAMHT